MPSGRDSGYQMTHYIRKILDVGALVSATPVVIGTMPAMGAPLRADTFVTALLSGTTNQLTIGFAADSLTTADVTAYVAAATIPASSQVLISHTLNTTNHVTPQNVERNVTVTFTGAATTGTLDVIFQFVPNR